MAAERNLRLRWGNLSGKFLRVLALVGVLHRGLSAPVAHESLEYQVKAAFLLNFVKFTEFPPSAFRDGDSPITICVSGDDPFGNALDQLVKGETVGGRKVVAQRIKRVPVGKACQVLFLHAFEKNTVETILAAVGSGVLTVGEGEKFIQNGGMIAFVIENRRVRFDVNQAAAESAGLKLSSKLLTVAKAVEK